MKLLKGAGKTGIPQTLTARVIENGKKIKLLMTIMPDGTIEWRKKRVK